MAERNGRIDATLWGVSDTELLAIVDDLADENGWTTTLSVRLQLGEREDTKHSGVGGRLAWMRRYGWLEKGEASDWRLTAMGRAIIDGGHLSKTLETALDRANAAQRVRMTRELAEGGHSSPSEIRAALRRQWTRSLGR
jgi:hypothetical protein